MTRAGKQTHEAVTAAPTDEQLDQACAWIARLRSDTVSTSDHRDFAKWLSQSPANRHAFDQMAELWGELGILAHLPIDQLFPESQPSASSTTKTKSRSSDTGAANSWRFARWMAGGGLAAACLTVILWMGSQWLTSPGLHEQVFVTQVGETRTLTLADGSRVQLNTNTELRVAYSREERRIQLLRGEAYFDVVRQTARPFTVDAGRANIRVLGTEFNVERNPNSTRISVTDGVVTVSEMEAGSGLQPESVKLTKNQKVTITRNGLGEVRRTTAEEALDWTRGVLVFNHTPLAEALEELSRYLEVPVAATPDVGNRTLSGTFELSDPDNALKAIATALGLHQDHSDPNLTLLSPRTN